MPDLHDLLRQVGAPFMYGILPSALVGLFPLWLALRRRRPVVGAFAYMTCAAIGLLTLIATGVNAGNLMTVVVYGLVAGLVASAAWSIFLLSTAT